MIESHPQPTGRFFWAVLVICLEHVVQHVWGHVEEKFVEHVADVVDEFVVLVPDKTPLDCLNTVKLDAVLQQNGDSARHCCRKMCLHCKSQTDHRRSSSFECLLLFLVVL